MKKVKNEKGEIAVLISSGYGAGWYSWNTSFKDCLFCPEIVNLIKDNDGEDLSTSQISEIEKIAEDKWGVDFYTGGARDLCVEWIPEGNPFKVDEYDGYESICMSFDDWVIA